MNTNTSTADSNTDKDDGKVIPLNFEPATKFDYDHNDIIGGVVQIPNGGFYDIMPSGLGFVYMKQIGNPSAKVQKFPIGKLLLDINNGNWPFFEKGDVSYKQYLFTPEQMEHKRNVLKSVIYHQLSVEANDTLLGTGDHDNYLKNCLQKANKALERKAKHNLQGVYGADPTMLTNLFNSIDKFVGRMADKLPHEFFYLNMVMDDYEADPQKFVGRKVELDKLDGDLADKKDNPETE